MNPSPEPKPNFSVKPGDIVTLGNHLLACGDAKDAALVERLLHDRVINLVVTDPPYGIAYVESKVGLTDTLSHTKMILNDHEQSDEEYRLFTRNWLLAMRSFLAKKNALYVFNSDKMIFPLREGFLAAGIKFAQLLVWAKTHSVIGRMDYLPQHELIAYGWYGTHAFLRSKDKSLLVHPKPQKSPLHPTMKPVGLLRGLILNSSRIEDTVYDPFGGSGSTLIACEDTKRRACLIELDPEYCETIIRRWERHTGRMAEHG